MTHKLNIIFQEDDHGFFVYCPELKGCHSQGDTFEEARKNIKEAIELYIETLNEEEIEELLNSKEIITSSMEVTLV